MIPGKISFDTFEKYNISLGATSSDNDHNKWPVNIINGQYIVIKIYELYITLLQLLGDNFWKTLCS